jgi:hypothetical protein
MPSGRAERYDFFLSRRGSVAASRARSPTFFADALDALGRTEEAKALRDRYGVTSFDDPKPDEPLAH